MEEIKLGARVVDTVTGFTGVATTRCDSVSSVPRIMVESAFDGKHHEEWFDLSRLAPAPPAEKKS